MSNGNTITPQDDNKNEIRFEFLDLISYRQKEYIVLLPADRFDDVLETVFSLFKERNKDYFTF